MRPTGLCCALLAAAATTAAVAWAGTASPGSAVRFLHETRDGAEVFSLTNSLVRCSVTVRSGALAGDNLELLSSAPPAGRRPLPAVESDADFALDVMWADWQAPGKAGNAENPVLLTRKDFVFRSYAVRQSPAGIQGVDLVFAGLNQPLEVRLAYELEPGAFFARRRLAVRLGAGPAAANASFPGPHFLRWTWPRRGEIRTPPGSRLLKAGGFGQPAALLANGGGAFFGLEYPTAENSLSARPDGGAELACGQEIGARIGGDWIEGESVVEAVTPDPFVKLWFWRYLDRVRAAAERPFVLYNSWYDLRSPDYKVGPDRILNEANLVRAAGLLRRKLVEERKTPLDAFVLDDGWDVYAGPWEMSSEQFPRGLKPVAEALAPMGSRLGIWIGPIGGYNRRLDRVNWLRDHGYETVDGEMCIAGERYRALLKERVTDFVRNDGVGYFKWDGLQFSCSEPGHGHLPDVYSRRAAMESVIDLCRTARSAGRDMFLNITSGTWLSPWWVKYADTIWMQGEDYGFADVPSISRRDRSTTYRDSVLYDDFRRRDFWFPLSSLMTHGVIRARVSPFADAAEPLDKFTDEIALYAARGIAMWELYVSPDLLTDGEWQAEAGAIRWLRSNFPTLRRVEMIGGDPRKLEPYGYAHFAGRRGIVALRNPGVETRTARIEFAPERGLAPDAAGLVLERIYPSRRIAPRLFRAGEFADAPLAGFETQIYEIYPLSEAREPLLAGAVFASRRSDRGDFLIDVYGPAEKTALLNPTLVRGASVDGRHADPARLEILPRPPAPAVTGAVLAAEPQAPGSCTLKFGIEPAAGGATLAILITPDAGSQGKDLPRLEVVGVGAGRLEPPAVEEEKKVWAWRKFAAGPGDYELTLRLFETAASSPWRGRLSAWLLSTEKLRPTTVTLKLGGRSGEPRTLLPLPFPPGVFPRTTPLGEASVEAGR